MSFQTYTIVLGGNSIGDKRSSGSISLELLAIKGKSGFLAKLLVGLAN